MSKVVQCKNLNCERAIPIEGKPYSLEPNRPDVKYKCPYCHETHEYGAEDVRNPGGEIRPLNR